MNLFLLDGLELRRVPTKSLDDGGSDLLVEYGGLDGLAFGAGKRNEKRGVDVVLVEAAMFGDFGTTGEDNAGVDLEDDVRGAGIAARIIPFVLEGLAGKDFLDSEGLLIFGQAQLRDNAIGEFLVGEPDERTILRNVEGLRGAEEGGRLAIADADALAQVDGGLSVLGANDDEGGLVDSLALEFAHDASKGLIHEVEFEGEALIRGAENVVVTAVHVS